jgi:hypothetical protein
MLPQPGAFHRSGILLPTKTLDKRHGLTLKTTDIMTACFSTDEIHEFIVGQSSFKLDSNLEGVNFELTLLRSS